MQKLQELGAGSGVLIEAGETEVWPLVENTRPLEQRTQLESYASIQSTPISDCTTVQR